VIITAVYFPRQDDKTGVFLVCLRLPPAADSGGGGGVVEDVPAFLHQKAGAPAWPKARRYGRMSSVSRRQPLRAVVPSARSGERFVFSPRPFCFSPPRGGRGGVIQDVPA